jgi:hypothetical protein
MNSPDTLSALLQSWQPDVAEPGDFNRGVWSRLEAAESQKGASFTGWISLFLRPRIAVTAALVVLCGGFFLGGLHARAESQEQYLLSLNPYKATSLLAPSAP